MWNVLLVKAGILSCHFDLKLKEVANLALLNTHFISPPTPIDYCTIHTLRVVSILV